MSTSSTVTNDAGTTSTLLRNRIILIIIMPTTIFILSKSSLFSFSQIKVWANAFTSLLFVLTHLINQYMSCFF